MKKEKVSWIFDFVPVGRVFPLERETETRHGKDGMDSEERIGRTGEHVSEIGLNRKKLAE